MKPVKEDSLKDYKIAIIEGKKKYVIEAMSFRRRILEEKEANKLRGKKKL